MNKNTFNVFPPVFPLATLTVVFIMFLFSFIILTFAQNILRKGLSLIIPEITLVCCCFSQIQIFIVVTLQSFLIKSIERSSGVILCNKINQKKDIIQSIDMYRKHQLATTSTFKILTESMRYSMVMCLFCYVLMIIINVYILIIEVNSTHPETFVSMVKAVAGSFILFAGVASMDQERTLSTEYFRIFVLTNKILHKIL